jgi:hypothetical protein
MESPTLVMGNAPLSQTLSASQSQPWVCESQYDIAPVSPAAPGAAAPATPNVWGLPLPDAYDSTPSPASPEPEPMPTTPPSERLPVAPPNVHPFGAPFTPPKETIAPFTPSDVPVAPPTPLGIVSPFTPPDAASPSLFTPPADANGTAAPTTVAKSPPPMPSAVFHGSMISVLNDDFVYEDFIDFETWSTMEAQYGGTNPSQLDAVWMDVLAGCRTREIFGQTYVEKNASFEFRAAQRSYAKRTRRCL